MPTISQAKPRGQRGAFGGVGLRLSGLPPHIRRKRRKALRLAGFVRRAKEERGRHLEIVDPLPVESDTGGAAVLKTIERPRPFFMKLVGALRALGVSP